MLEVKEEEIELLQIFQKAEKLINKVKIAHSSKERDSTVEKCKFDLKHCKNIIKRIEIETRDMETEHRLQVRQMLKDRARDLKKLKSDLKWAKNEHINRQNNNSQGKEEKYDNLDAMNEDEIIDYAKNIQNEDIQILDRVIMDVEQTQNEAQDVAQHVANQTDQIKRIGIKLEDIDDELERAKRILKIMVRRVMTDKIIWIVAGLIFTAVVVIVLLNVDAF
eukprot:UN02600